MRRGAARHEGIPRSPVFWTLVAVYIDAPDLSCLRDDWHNDGLFVDVSVHVAECLHCLQRRLFMVKTWDSGGPPADEVW